jgi:putative chitinase
MKFDIATLIDAGLGPTQARLFFEPLLWACQRFEINTPARVAAFLGQCHVESAGFTTLEENLRYRQPERLRAIFPSRVPDLATAAKLVAAGPQAIANRVYAGRIGNGDEASGDGWRFRGRGIKQLTGRANYADAAVALARPYVQQPELVALPQDACLTAAWFWHSRKCNVLADAWNIDAITRAVNGPGMLQAQQRKSFSDDAVRALTEAAV